MMLDIGRLTLLESCRQMAAWQRRVRRRGAALMCVNVSSRQFAHGDLAAEIEAMLRTDRPASRATLKLEITESAFIGDCPRPAQTR